MSSTDNVKKNAALIRRHATVHDIKRRALAAASIRSDEVIQLNVTPTTYTDKPQHQLAKVVCCIKQRRAHAEAQSSVTKGGRDLPTQL